MSILSDYVTGTLTVTNGSTAFTGAGTGWLAAGFKEGDTLIDITGATEYMGVVATITANGAGTLTRPWEGPTRTNVAYRMRYQPDGARMGAQARNLIEVLGNGNLVAFAGLTGAAGKLPMFTAAGVMTLINRTDLVSGANYDVQVATLAARAAYDGQAQGYAVLVADVGDGRAAIYSKNSGTTADWSAAAYVTGPIGAASTVPGITWRGTYSGATAYVINDGVKFNGSSFRNISAGTGVAPSSANPPVDNASWVVVASKGSDGTGTGDVVGPVSSADGNLAVLSGASGKVIRDGGPVAAAVDAVLQSYFGLAPAIVRWNGEQSASRVRYAGTGLTSSDSQVSGGNVAAGRTAVSGAVGESARQDGFIRTAKISVNAVGSAPSNNIRLKVLRPNGASYDVIASSEYLTATTTGMNTFNLATPLPVEPGDQIGIWLKGGGAGVCTLLNSMTTTSVYRYIGAEAVGGETYTDIANISVLTDFQGIKPFIDVFGESIIEGHNGATMWHSYAHTGFGPAGLPAAEPFNQVRALVPTLAYQNYALGGSLWSDYIAKATLAAANALPRAVAVAGGVNDIVAGTLWATVEGQMNAFKAAFAAGTKIFIAEILPYTPGTDAQAATIRTWNSNYAAWCIANGATLIPCWNAMGQVRPSTGFKDDLITAYHYSGGHLTVPAGVNAYAALLSAGLQSVLWL